ncbi:DNA processing protein DprA [Rickettsiales bacterium Ac37b]|nr:DNA processing protein DprA [Rickettsiales bacterium Ac37b]
MQLIFNDQSKKEASIEEEIINHLRLIRSENIGPKSFISLVELYGSVKNAILAIPELSKRGGKTTPIKICSISKAEEELENVRKIGGQIICYKNTSYPSQLLTIDDFPPVLTILGDINLFNNKIIAVVGSRNASANGRNFAYTLAKDLAEQKIITVSGLARGIDTAAHNGALENYTTIAVIAGGIDNIYPPENKELYSQIAQKGAIVAELPYGSVPRGQNFPQRNRIISGLSHGVVVVEASFGSGSLITARMALEQNREVFAVPGFPLDPRCKGTNHLIKQGAKLVESAKDIIEEINFTDHINVSYIRESNPASFHAACYNIDENELLKARIEVKSLLNASPIDINDIVKMLNFAPQTILTVILELAGKVERIKGNKISLKF